VAFLSFLNRKPLSLQVMLFFRYHWWTDLNTGRYRNTEHSIRTQLFTLPDNYRVFPGHGPQTRIGAEKLHNPFFLD
jgi:glyoxylase-like metal-dependent hydrolase (beta-lactamase superfamily II)